MISIICLPFGGEEVKFKKRRFAFSGKV